MVAGTILKQQGLNSGYSYTSSKTTDLAGLGAWGKWEADISPIGFELSLLDASPGFGNLQPM